MHRYALRDDQWAKIRDFQPGREGHVGGTAADNRLFVDAVIYRYRTGIPGAMCQSGTELGSRRTGAIAMVPKAGYCARFCVAAADSDYGFMRSTRQLSVRFQSPRHLLGQGQTHRENGKASRRPGLRTGFAVGGRWRPKCRAFTTGLCGTGR